jgi:hypothetical protein
MPNRQLAVATSAAYPELRPDWPLLRHALATHNIEATTAVWTDPEVDWTHYDLVLANGAWDNIHHPQEFQQWADRVAALTQLENAPAILRWNVDKRYLSVLAEHGVTTLPTTWVDPADPVVDLPDGEFVIKPTISGGGFESARYGSQEHAAAHIHLVRLAALGRTAMVQPYAAKVDELGELGLIFLGSEFSHAIRKRALLQSGAGVQVDLYQQEIIIAATPKRQQLEAARSALQIAESLLGPTTYARVDLIPLSDGTPAVLELELLDPALFFETNERATNRFAQVLRQRLA